MEKIVTHFLLGLYVFCDEFEVIFGIVVATLVHFYQFGQTVLSLVEILVELPDVDLEEYGQNKYEKRLYVVP